MHISVRMIWKGSTQCVVNDTLRDYICIYSLALLLLVKFYRTGEKKTAANKMIWHACLNASGICQIPQSLKSQSARSKKTRNGAKQPSQRAVPFSSPTVRGRFSETFPASPPRRRGSGASAPSAGCSGSGRVGERRIPVCS